MRNYRVRILIEGLGPGPEEHTELILGNQPADSMKEIVDRAKTVNLGQPEAIDPVNILASRP